LIPLIKHKRPHICIIYYQTNTLYIGKAISNHIPGRNVIFLQRRFIQLIETLLRRLTYFYSPPKNKYLCNIIIIIIIHIQIWDDYRVINLLNTTLYMIIHMANIEPYIIYDYSYGKYWA